MKAVHLKVRVNCECCSEHFPSKTELKLHKIRQHSLEAPYKCNLCGQPFLFLSQFKIHMNSQLSRSDTDIGCRTRTKTVVKLTYM